MCLLFVGGVHGVGKSTCCEEVSKRRGLQWFTASALIKTEKQSAIAQSSKKVLDVLGNQDLLIRGVRKHVSSDNRKVILDGHFTLLEPEGEIIGIEVDVFAQLGLEGIVIFRDNPESICTRLRERDGQYWPLSNVSAHQDAEIKQGYTVAEELGIPIRTLEAFDTNGLERAVAEFQSAHITK